MSLGWAETISALTFRFTHETRDDRQQSEDFWKNYYSILSDATFWFSITTIGSDPIKALIKPHGVDRQRMYFDLKHRGGEAKELVLYKMAGSENYTTRVCLEGTKCREYESDLTFKKFFMKKGVQAKNPKDSWSLTFDQDGVEIVASEKFFKKRLRHSGHGSWMLSIERTKDEDAGSLVFEGLKDPSGKRVFEAQTVVVFADSCCF